MRYAIDLPLQCFLDLLFEAVSAENNASFRRLPNRQEVLRIDMPFKQGAVCQTTGGGGSAHHSLILHQS